MNDIQRYTKALQLIRDIEKDYEVNFPFKKVISRPIKCTDVSCYVEREKTDFQCVGYIIREKIGEWPGAGKRCLIITKGEIK